MLNWFSRKRDTPDCGWVRPRSDAERPVEDEGIAKLPSGNRALSMASETGLMFAAVIVARPGMPLNAVARAAAVRLLSVSPVGITGTVTLFVSEAPFRSRVP